MLTGRPMIEPLTSLGYASKAFIYAIVGGLAAAAHSDRVGGSPTLAVRCG